jgi:hypothetical protein
LPATITRNGESIVMDVKGIGAKVVGKLNADRSEISGDWTQGGKSLPLVIKRTKDGASLGRRSLQKLRELQLI